MKKRIVTGVITACLALCAAVWPQPDTREERPALIPTHAAVVGDLHRWESVLYNKKICGRI